jgi:hypothetical protein
MAEISELNIDDGKGSKLPKKETFLFFNKTKTNLNNPIKMLQKFFMNYLLDVFLITKYFFQDLESAALSRNLIS